MKPLLQTLDSNESILLMYLAGELPAEEKAEVDGLLQSDAGLRAHLQTLRAEQGTLFETIASADRRSQPVLPKETVVRQTNRLLLEFVNRPTVPVAAAQPRRMRQMLIGVGVAAAVLIGGISYWGIMGSSGSQSLAPLSNDVAQTDDSSAQDGATPAEAVANADLLQQSLEPGQSTFDDSSKHVDLADAESQIRVVAELSDPQSIDQGVSFH